MLTGSRASRATGLNLLVNCSWQHPTTLSSLASHNDLLGFSFTLCSLNLQKCEKYQSFSILILWMFPHICFLSFILGNISYRILQKPLYLLLWSHFLFFFSPELINILRLKLIFLTHAFHFYHLGIYSSTVCIVG